MPIFSFGSAQIGIYIDPLEDRPPGGQLGNYVYAGLISIQGSESVNKI